MTLSANARGVALMCASMFAFTVNDSFMKAVTQTQPLYQTIFLRGLIATVGLLTIGVVTRQLSLRMSRRDVAMVAVRSLADVAATVLFLTALMHMPLANLSAILQALPLAVTLGAAVIYGERFGWRRMTAIVVGFIGVMLIIRPGTEGFDQWSLMGVGSVMCVVVRDLSVRRIDGQVPALIVALGASVAVTLMGLVGAYADRWEPVGISEALMILGAGVMLTAGYLTAVMAMRTGDISLVAPFRYTSLLWAIALGWVAFRTLPDGLTLIGAAIVVASGIYTLWRERKVRARPQ